MNLSECNAKLRQRIEAQIATEDAVRVAPVVAGTPQSAEPMRRGQSPDCRVEVPAPSVGYRVTLIQCRRKLLDEHDSMRFAVKPTVDFITEWLGFKSDADPRLQFEYGQLATKGAEGVIVRIELCQ